MTCRIVEETLAQIHQRIPEIDDITATDVRIGLGYTGVLLDTGDAGVCYTLHSEMEPHCCTIVEKAGTLVHSPAKQLASLATSWDIGESVVGVATMNALSQIILDTEEAGYRLEEGDLLEYVRPGSGDEVTLVGNIGPFAKALRGKVKNLNILERNPDRRNRETLPDAAAEQVIPQSDVVFISGSSIANKTIDRVLELSQNAREVGVVGASSSIIPDALFDHGATVLGGIRPVNADRLMHIVSEGGGTREIMTAAEFTVIRRPAS